MRLLPVSRRLLAVGLCLLLASATQAELKVLLPQGRTVYQTNEWIDVSVVRTGQALPAGNLMLTLAGDDGSKITVTFGVPALAQGTGTEHYHINGRLLRPGSYLLTAAADGATATSPIEIYSHRRKSSFRLINWGRAKDKQQLIQG